MTFAELLPFAILGGLLGLDVVSFPQAMISRPLVAATVAGALAGDALAGFMVGALLELVALGTLPFGASRYPEWGSASVAGGVMHVWLLRSGFAADGALVIAALVTLVTAWAGGITMVWLRKLNARWARRSLTALASGSGRAILRLQAAGLTADFLRGASLSMIAMATATLAAGVLRPGWNADPQTSIALLLVVVGSVAVFACWRLFNAVSRSAWLFGGGLALGLLLIWAR